jgi:hypothetical protein
VNTDYGVKASAFDRIQVDVLVRIATAAARMVEIGATRLSGIREKTTPHSTWGLACFCQYSLANMIVSTRVTTGSLFAPLTFGSSYKLILPAVAVVEVKICKRRPNHSNLP